MTSTQAATLDLTGRMPILNEQQFSRFFGNLMALHDRHCSPTTIRLDPNAFPPLLAELPGWNVCNSRLGKTFQWSNFTDAIAFVNRIADLAESENHHPDICIHYTKVDVSLWTHSAGGISENDFILAARIDNYATSS